MKSIDLHGVKHADVENILIDACSRYEIPFTVITGKSKKMKDVVAKAVTYFGLCTRDSVDNPGRIIIYESR